MNMLLVIHLIFSGDDSLQNCRDRGRSENLGGRGVIIPPPPVEIGLTDRPKSGRGPSSPPGGSTIPVSKPLNVLEVFKCKQKVPL